MSFPKFQQDWGSESRTVKQRKTLEKQQKRALRSRQERIANEILMSLRFSKKFQNDISLYEPIGTDRDGNEIVMLDVINSETPDFAEQLHLAIESEKMLHAVQERLRKREQIVVIFRYGLWGQEELTQQEIAGRLGISRSYVYRHIYCK